MAAGEYNSFSGSGYDDIAEREACKSSCSEYSFLDLASGQFAGRKEEIMSWRAGALLAFLTFSSPLCAEQHRLRLSEEEVTKIAIGILLGDPYGRDETQVRKNIVSVTYATAAPCDEGPAWQVTVYVPATTDADAINGTFAINDVNGKPVCIGLPFLDGVELSTLPLTSPERPEPVSETETAPAQTTLPDLLQ